MTQEKEIIEAYIYLRTGERVQIDLSKVARSPRQLVMFWDAYQKAVSWIKNNVTIKQ
jgi:hypothetical protein